MTVSRLAVEAYHQVLPEFTSADGRAPVDRLAVVDVTTTPTGHEHQASAASHGQQPDASGAHGVATGLGQLARAVLGGDLLVPGVLVDDVALVDEGPALGLVGGPVGLAELQGGLAVRHVVHRVAGDGLRLREGVHHGVPLLVQSGGPDGRVDAVVVVSQDPGRELGVLGLAEVPVLVLGQVEGHAGRGLLVRDRVEPELGPTRRVDALVAALVGAEDGGVRRVGGRRQVALLVAHQVVGDVRHGHLVDDRLGVTELVPAVEGRLREPAGVVDVGGRGAVLGAPLLVGSDVLGVDDLLGVTELVPAVEGREREPAGVVGTADLRAVLAPVDRHVGRGGLVDDRLGVTELVPVSEGRLREPAGVVDVGGRGAVLGAPLLVGSDVLGVDDLLVLELGPALE